MNTPNERIYYLDAVRAFALLLGIAFHAALSFITPNIGWATKDNQANVVMNVFAHMSSSFRMVLFFLIAGFFSHMVFHRKGGLSFAVSRFLRLAIPFVVGWFLLRPLMRSGWHWAPEAQGGNADLWVAIKGSYDRIYSALPDGIFVDSHLWFLYYLMVITVGILVLRWIFVSTIDRRGHLRNLVDSILDSVFNSYYALLFFVVPTTGALWYMNGWGVNTPDKSLIPGYPTLALYGGGFLLGFVLHRTPILLLSLSRLSFDRLVLVVVSAFVTYWMRKNFAGQTGHPDFLWIRLGYVFSFAVMMWTLVFGTMGIFRRFLNQPNRVVRYVSSSSYWLYLMHLPIVVWLQVYVANFHYHWALKMGFIMAVSLAVLFVSYHLLVRWTYVGWILNGRMYPIWGGKKKE